MSIIRAIDAAIFEWRRDRKNDAVKAIYLGEFDYNDFCSAVEPILVRLTPNGRVEYRGVPGYRVNTPNGRVEYRGVPVYRVNTQRHLAVS